MTALRLVQCAAALQPLYGAIGPRCTADAPAAANACMVHSVLRSASKRQCTVPRRQSYNLHPYVKSGVLTLALNGTLTSTDLVNVTVTVRFPLKAACAPQGFVCIGLAHVTAPGSRVTSAHVRTQGLHAHKCNGPMCWGQLTIASTASQVPDTLAADIVNVTATGQSYVEFKFKNVTTTDTFQVNAVQVLLLEHHSVCASSQFLQFRNAARPCTRQRKQTRR